MINNYCNNYCNYFVTGNQFYRLKNISATFQKKFWLEFLKNSMDICFYQKGKSMHIHTRWKLSKNSFPDKSPFRKASEIYQLHSTYYRTRVIISRSLYISNPIFLCRLYWKVVSITDNLCTKQGNSSIF